MIVELIVVLAMAVALAMDALAVSIAQALRVPGVVRRQGVLLAFWFGLFQAGMPVIGWFLGTGMANVIEAYDHWLAFALLTVVGGKMLVEGLRGGDEERPDHSWPSLRTQLVLAVATSIDALAVGIGLAVTGQGIWLPATIIGVVTFLLSGAGVMWGRHLGVRFGRGAEIAGGCILILIGLRILIDHLG